MYIKKRDSPKTTERKMQHSLRGPVSDGDIERDNLLTRIEQDKKDPKIVKVPGQVCPECGGPLESKHSRVSCTSKACNYWFCF
jgi:hypothetical protein